MNDHGIDYRDYQVEARDAAFGEFEGVKPTPPPTARCHVCHEAKSTACFWKDRSRASGIANRCRECNVTIKQDQDMRRLYGICLIDYYAMLDAQGGRCAICDGASPGKGKRGMFCVDHDHVTGEVRGLLCNDCNRAIGLLKDNLQSIRKALNYVANGGNTYA